MNVTGVEWRDFDPHEARFPSGQRHRRPPHPEQPAEEEDVVEIQGDTAEEMADGLDVVE